MCIGKQDFSSSGVTWHRQICPASDIPALGDFFEAREGRVRQLKHSNIVCPTHRIGLRTELGEMRGKWKGEKGGNVRRVARNYVEQQLHPDLPKPPVDARSDLRLSEL